MHEAGTRRDGRVIRALALGAVTSGVALGAAATAGAQGGAPWPGPVEGGANMLAGTPFAVNGAPAALDARLAVWLDRGGLRATVVTRRIGSRQLLQGRLINPQGNRAIRGALVTVAREIVDRPGWKVLRTVQTSRRGGFGVTLPPGPTRRFGAFYYATAVNPVPIYSRRVQVRSSSRVSIRAQRRRRGLVVFRGRVSGARVPSGGLLVAIQVNNRGTWPAVRLARAGADGRFTARYRFAVRRRGFSVRARVPRQTGWRLLAGTSRTLRVQPRR